MSREQEPTERQAPSNAVESPVQRKQTTDVEARFQHQALNELGARPIQRKLGGPSARQQSLGEIDTVIQRRASRDAEPVDDVQQTARAGVAGAGQELPHAERIQASFGKHDVSGVRAQVGGDAAEASEALGAEAYATGDRVAFAKQPDLHTAAHEAAHTVQQGAGAVSGNGVDPSPAHEQAADQVADAVVAGESAEPLLDAATGGQPATASASAGAGITQRKATGTFVPELETDDRRAQMRLGEVYPHRVRVANERAAPKGMKYAWSHTVDGPPHRAVAKPDLEGPATSWPFVVRGVGDYRVASRVQYGASKGPLDEAQTAMDVVVARPTAHDVELETERDHKRRPFAGNMLVGEELVITTQLHDLRRASRDPLEDVRAHVMVPGLVFKGVKTLTNGIYEIRLHARQEGGALGVVAALPYDAKLGDTPVHSIRAEISKADDEGNPGARPNGFAEAKSWLKTDYNYMFLEMRNANTALSAQTLVNDPPPKQSVWMDILLGCATAALGGAMAGVGLAVAKRLVKDASVVVEEGVKSFLEQSVMAAATATFRKDEIAKHAPHVSFRMLHESAINAKQADFEKLHLANVLLPQLDALEQGEPGAGLRKAMDLDRAMKAEIPNVKKIQYDASFEQWVKFVTKAQLGERENPTDPAGETGTDMSKQVHRDWRHKLPSTAGVIEIDLGGTNVFDPKTPVKIERARMPGFNQGLRQQIADQKVKDLPFALRVEGSAPGRYDSTYTFARNENREYWLSKHDHEYLERKAGGSALAGAMKILEQEIGNEQITPEA
ncbi:MAG: DUF4157 domain-containing protein [Myxococcota bacterium]|nr:DUF4157 domain-containing protein [Myxococcota bacterium]